MSGDNPFTKAVSVIRAGGVGGLGRGRSFKEPVHTSIADQCETPSSNTHLERT